jgi:hypothetical protein
MTDGKRIKAKQILMKSIEIYVKALQKRETYTGNQMQMR